MAITSLESAIASIEFAWQLWLIVRFHQAWARLNAVKSELRP